jgi:hypothetical protein
VSEYLLKLDEETRAEERNLPEGGTTNARKSVSTVVAGPYDSNMYSSLICAD